MTDPHDPWPRFCCPRGAAIPLDDEGYLSDPELPYHEVENAAVVPFESLVQARCLVLLGEPGMGKSTALAQYQAIMEQQWTGTEHVTHRLDLGAYQSDMRLHHALVESTICRAWREGTHHLHLFLDSLDECLLRINAVIELLIEVFEHYHDSIDRLRLCIACRTAEWPVSLEHGLQRIWGNNVVQVVELAPLRSQDVIATAQEQQIGTDAFLAEVARTQAVPFAITPITLTFLLRLYQRDGHLPQTKTEVYRRGCL